MERPGRYGTIQTGPRKIIIDHEDFWNSPFGVEYEQTMKREIWKDRRLSEAEKTRLLKLAKETLSKFTRKGKLDNVDTLSRLTGGVLDHVLNYHNAGFTLDNALEKGRKDVAELIRRNGSKPLYWFGNAINEFNHRVSGKGSLLHGRVELQAFAQTYAKYYSQEYDVDGRELRKYLSNFFDDESRIRTWTNRFNGRISIQTIAEFRDYLRDAGIPEFKKNPPVLRTLAVTPSYIRIFFDELTDRKKVETALNVFLKSGGRLRFTRQFVASAEKGRLNPEEALKEISKIELEEKEWDGFENAFLEMLKQGVKTNAKDYVSLFRLGKRPFLRDAPYDFLARNARLDENSLRKTWMLVKRGVREQTARTAATSGSPMPGTGLLKFADSLQSYPLENVISLSRDHTGDEEKVKRVIRLHQALDSVAKHEKNFLLARAVENALPARHVSEITKNPAAIAKHASGENADKLLHAIVDDDLLFNHLHGLVDRFSAKKLGETGQHGFGEEIAEPDQKRRRSKHNNFQAVENGGREEKEKTHDDRMAEIRKTVVAPWVRESDPRVNPHVVHAILEELWFGKGVHYGGHYLSKAKLKKNTTRVLMTKVKMRFQPTEFESALKWLVERNLVEEAKVHEGNVVSYSLSTPTKGTSENEIFQAFSKAKRAAKHYNG